MVDFGQLVKKDQPLMSYTVPVDELAIEEKEMSIKKNEETFKKMSEQKEQDIAKNVSKLMTMDGTSIEAQILNLNIQKMQIAYEQYKYQTQKSLDKQKEELEELKADQGLKYIKAPFDGIIYGYDNRLKKNEILEHDQSVIYMADINSAVFGAESAGASRMWYNLEVEINPIVNRKESTQSIKGKVVAIDSLLNGEATTGMVYIKPDSFTSEMVSPQQSANITTDAIVVKDVLLIPSKAVKSDRDLKYVYILDSAGEEHKQYISGRDNGSETWVYNGLSEGQEIVIE